MIALDDLFDSLGRGFADLQILLETGFKQLEKFYLETGGSGGGPGGGGPSAGAGSSGLGGGGGLARGSSVLGGVLAESAHGGAAGKAADGTGHYRNAVEETMANLREESSAALERQRALLDVSGV